MEKTIGIEDMAAFCKKKGFVYPSGEIYGGLSGFWDYGPLGSELKKNLKDSWWKYHVQNREDIVGIDGSIITNPTVWEASGHVDCFTDVYVVCKKCKKPNKLDKNEVGKVKCECGSDYDVKGDINMMFTTQVGPVEGTSAYLRPETAQLIFSNFKLVAENARLKLPFGIAQMGKALEMKLAQEIFYLDVESLNKWRLSILSTLKKQMSARLLKKFLIIKLLFGVKIYRLKIKKL